MVVHHTPEPVALVLEYLTEFVVFNRCHEFIQLKTGRTIQRRANRTARQGKETQNTKTILDHANERHVGY